MDNIEQIRPLKRQKDQNIFEDWASVAEDTAIFSTHILNWCMREHPTDGWNSLYKMAYITLLRHLSELLDALPQTLLNRQISVSHILLRSILEATISILFILDKDSDRRVEAYHFMDAINDIKRRNLQDSSSKDFAQYDRMHTIDLVLGPQPAVAAEDLHGLRARKIQELKMLSRMPNAAAECRKLRALRKKKGRSRDIEWYMFFSNIRSIRQMAIEVNLGATYDFLYSRYSGKVHPVNLLKDVIIHDVTRNTITSVPLRSVKQGREATSAREIEVISSKCALLCFVAYEKRFLQSHSEEIKGWWKEHSKKQADLSKLIVDPMTA